jgi:AcrR family transcriptional regulator
VAASPPTSGVDAVGPGADGGAAMDDIGGLLAQFEPEGLGPEGPGWQQRKSAQTRTGILEAAIDCLANHGYARTTTQLIAETADISRGAMLHHYPTKGALIEAIIAYCVYKRMQMLSEGVRNISEMQRVQEFAGLEILWRSFFTREHRAYLELSIAARTDPELRESFIPQARRFSRIWREAGVRIFPEWAVDPRRLALASGLVESVLEGLALNQAAWDSPERVAQARAFLRQTIGLIFNRTLNFRDIPEDTLPADAASAGLDGE